jgi:hypothetical protein
MIRYVHIQFTSHAQMHFNLIISFMSRLLVSLDDPRRIIIIDCAYLQTALPLPGPT